MSTTNVFRESKDLLALVWFFFAINYSKYLYWDLSDKEIKKNLVGWDDSNYEKGVCIMRPVTLAEKRYRFVRNKNAIKKMRLYYQYEKPERSGSEIEKVIEGTT